MTMTTPPSRTAPSCTPMSRTEKYIARVNAYLPGLADDAARFEFLTGELAKWEERRDAFIRKVDAGGEPEDVTIFDYAETIAALEIEQAKVSPLRAVREELGAGAKEMAKGVERLEKAVGDASMKLKLASPPPHSEGNHPQFGGSNGHGSGSV